MKLDVCSSVLVAGLAVALPASADADPCEPARTSQELGELEENWRSALISLVDATRDAEQPWGCPEATLRLDVLEQGATLRVERGGSGPISRHLTDPEDVVVMGKAMLARALPPPAPPQPLATVARDPVAVRDQTAEEAADPAAYLQATGSARYAGVTDAIALGAAGRATIPIGNWSIGLGLRYVTLAADTGARTATQDFEYSELSIAGGLGYAVVTDPVLFRLGLYGALAIVDMDLDQATQTTELEVESGAVDGRAGLELRLSVPLWGPLWLTTSIDGEIAPASIANSDRRVDPMLPPLPAYMIGTDVGLEVAIP